MRAVILAGGRGSRLAPYTTVFPKPLLPVGDRPILDVILRQLAEAGFDRVTLAVGYKFELLMAYFGDGSQYGLELDYSREAGALGTAGPLLLVRDFEDPTLVMNGDILCSIDFEELIGYHKRNGGVATIATFSRRINVDFGVIEMDNAHQLTAYREKPTHEYKVSMGIYVFSPVVLNSIPAERHFDFPDLVQALLGVGKPVNCYPFDGFWLDVGRREDYELANQDWEDIRNKLKL